MLSVVIPAYNEEDMVPMAAARLGEVLEEAGIAHELLFVDDGSQDGTWLAIEAAQKESAVVRGVRFSRNFGKEAAIYAGLSAAKGDCCAVIDCDLQHPPEKLVEMFALWQQGYEVVEGKKASRGREGVLHRWFAGLFYKLITKATGVEMARTSDFKLLDRKAVNAMMQMPEQHLFFRAMSAWIGFKTATVEFEVQQRTAGASKWSSFSLTKYAIRNIATFSTAPMQLVTVAGVLVVLTTLVFGVQTFVKWASGTAVEGFTTVILLLLFIGGTMMLSLGVVGYYIARIYDEVKGRPKYIVAQQIGGQEGETD